MKHFYFLLLTLQILKPLDSVKHEKNLCIEDVGAAARRDAPHLRGGESLHERVHAAARVVERRRRSR